MELVSFPERSDLKTAVLDKQPFFLKRMAPSMVGHHISKQRFDHVLTKTVQVTRDEFSHDKRAVLQKLRDAAITDSCCGQYAAVERKLITSSKSKPSESDVTVYAIVTNISRHNIILSPDPIPGGINQTSARCLEDEKSTPNQGGTGGATTRAVWNPLVDQLFANVMVNYMMHTRKSAGEWLDSAGWDMVASEFNRRNSSTYNVNQLKKRFGTLKRLYKSVKELLAASGFGWDESSKLVVAEVAVWDNYLKSHPSAAQFRTTAFPAYELMSILCGDSSDFKSFDKLGGSSPMVWDAASASSSHEVLGKPQLSPDEAGMSCHLPSKENGNFVSQFEGGTGNPLPRRKRSLTHHCKRECVQQMGSDISDSLCEMETKPKFAREQRTSEAQSPADYSISNCVKELMKIAPVNPISRVIASSHFENANVREMFMVWGKEERIAWLDMISKER
ncbi:ditrans,polycis-polyprenyl diphosphate synthase [Asimina triloba]